LHFGKQQKERKEKEGHSFIQKTMLGKRQRRLSLVVDSEDNIFPVDDVFPDVRVYEAWRLAEEEEDEGEKLRRAAWKDEEVRRLVSAFFKGGDGKDSPCRGMEMFDANLKSMVLSFMTHELETMAGYKMKVLVNKSWLQEEMYFQVDADYWRSGTVAAYAYPYYDQRTMRSFFRENYALKVEKGSVFTMELMDMASIVVFHQYLIPKIQAFIKSGVGVQGVCKCKMENGKKKECGYVKRDHVKILTSYQTLPAWLGFHVNVMGHPVYDSPEEQRDMINRGIHFFMDETRALELFLEVKKIGCGGIL